MLPPHARSTRKSAGPDCLLHFVPLEEDKNRQDTPKRPRSATPTAMKVEPFHVMPDKTPVFPSMPEVLSIHTRPSAEVARHPRPRSPPTATNISPCAMTWE